ncbi:hypothetical protein DRN86_02955 [Candidatus Geothermarchaeota archaeon]|nr:MAG: hypothetical protein DRN86_02955 [Candidatus Geothermarchaeota archaeon]
MSEIYRGYWQRGAIETIIVGMVVRKSILLIGLYATYKSSLSLYTAKIFDKPVIRAEASFKIYPS